MDILAIAVRHTEKDSLNRTVIALWFSAFSLQSCRREREKRDNKAIIFYMIYRQGPKTSSLPTFEWQPGWPFNVEVTFFFFLSLFFFCSCFELFDLANNTRNGVYPKII